MPCISLPYPTLGFWFTPSVRRDHVTVTLNPCQDLDIVNRENGGGGNHGLENGSHGTVVEFLLEGGYNASPGLLFSSLFLMHRKCCTPQETRQDNIIPHHIKNHLRVFYSTISNTHPPTNHPLQTPLNPHTVQQQCLPQISPTLTPLLPDPSPPSLPLFPPKIHPLSPSTILNPPIPQSPNRKAHAPPLPSSPPSTPHGASLPPKTYPTAS